MADWQHPERPTSPLLPAFVIRDLHGPSAPPGVVQMTGSQYSSTVKSQPDATLRYLDDDDGELITVGSSFELQQRLDDPVKQPSHSFPFTPSNENQMMHIFDIQKTVGSLAVWRDHEAYSRKNLRKGSPFKDDTIRLNSPISPISLEPSTPTSPIQSNPQAEKVLAAQQASLPAGNKASSHPIQLSASSPASSSHEQMTVQLDQAFGNLFEGIQSQLGPLADFLETAADGLRKAAEKTAESDTTAVENVLTGFKGIWTELGQMGREFLDSIDEQLQKDYGPKDNTSSVSKPPSVPQSSCRKESEVSPKLETVSKRVSFIETPAPPAKGLSIEPPSTNDRFADKAFGPSTSFNAWAQKPMFPPSLPTSNPPSKQFFQGCSVKNSILDWETSDPDFSTRYPPLLSLRKAKSVSGIHDKGQPLLSSRDSFATGSALSRFPSINQFEQQNRSKAKPQSATLKRDETLGHSSSGSPPKSTTYKEPIIKDSWEQSPHESFTNTSSAKNQNRPPPSWSPTSLPGSWPEPKANDPHESPRKTPATRTSWPAHSPYIPLPDADTSVQPLSVRLSSPVSETYSRAPIFPRRHQTVSSTNPAARLNGPFDPLANFPALQPRPQISQPDLKHWPDNTTGRPAFETPNIPGAFPQRSRTVHHTERYKPQPQPGAFNYSRPTLWDNYLRNHANKSVPSLSSLPKPDNVHTGFHMKAPSSMESGVVHQQMFNLPSQKPMQPATKPQPLVAQPTVRPERSEPNLASFTTRPPRTIVTVPTSRFSYTSAPPTERAPSATIAVEQCVQTLRSMGYGSDANELARLNVYAGAAAGNIEDAIEMIEEEREAAKELDDSKDLEQIRNLDD